MPRAISAQMRVPFTMACDRGLAPDDPARTVFWTRPLTRREEIALAEILDALADEPGGPSRVAERINARIDQALGFGLVGWERFLDGDDVRVEFERSPDAAPSEQPYLAHMDGPTQIEVAEFIRGGCRLTRDDAGKSDGPSCSDSAGTDVPAQPAE